MRKKLLVVVAVCLAVLLGAVVAYHYLSQNGSNPKTFTFSWTGSTAEKFNVTKFWMNITFERTNETHLTITVKVNDLSPGCLGMVFDVNHNEEIDEYDRGYLYNPLPYSIVAWDNTTTEHYGAQPAFLGPYREDGQRFFEVFVETRVFDTHICEFDPALGYTYIIPVNIENVFSAELYSTKVAELTNDLIHVEYDFAVAVEFRFGMGLIT